MKMDEVKWIADIGSNHNRDLNRIDMLIEAAADCGCHAVKVQLFAGDRLFANEFPVNQKEALKNELPAAWLPGIASLCRRVGLELHATPFDLQSLELCRPFVDALKVASYSILDIKLIQAVARAGKPMSLSTGLATAEEINEAFLAARSLNHRLTMYHCAAAYPAPPAVCDLEVIALMRHRYESVGWSDHSREPGVVHYAVALGARYVEFHLDLQDGLGKESVHGHCWTPTEITAVIAQTKAALPALRPAVGYDFSVPRKWRADPDDSARPVKRYRQELLQK